MENLVVSKFERPPEPIRWVRIAEWMLLLLLAAQMGVRTFPKAWHTLNTDFPSYYLTASLVHERYDTSRIYDWLWLQRQKDHRGIDQRLIGMVPSTPFSTLIVYPLTSLSALPAKRCWLIVNVGLLFVTLSILQRLTRLSWRRLCLVAALSFPLRVNFLFGQYYVLLLFSLTLACWLYIRQRRFLAGVVVGLATGLKVFPAVYLIYFLRKKDFKAFMGGVVSTLGAGAVAIYAFGWELHRIYLLQILPSALRGEGLDPYNLQAASLSSVLHKLFIYEPQLNQHPAINAPWLFAVLHPLLQMMLVAPVLLLVAPKETSSRRVQLEWAAILLASLAISTTSSSYLFTLLILPACLIWGVFQKEKSNWCVPILLFLYVITGFLGGTDRGGEGWAALLAVPRLYTIILLCIFVDLALMRKDLGGSAKHDRLGWSLALVTVLTFSITSNLRRQQGLYADYQWRIPVPKGVFMALYPTVEENATLYVAMRNNGYHVAVERFGATEFSGTGNDDDLGIAVASGDRLVERTGYESQIISASEGRTTIHQAESPVTSFDGRWLAFLREDHGRARIWIHALKQQDDIDRPLTPPTLNVLEMSFLPKGELIFSALSSGRPGLFVVDQVGGIRPLDVGETRYPSVSPNGNWLAYSQLHGGTWNLWLRNLSNGQTRRLTNAACNTTEPAWTADSQTLIYASDCGRALWFSALCRRQIIY